MSTPFLRRFQPNQSSPENIETDSASDIKKIEDIKEKLLTILQTEMDNYLKRRKLPRVNLADKSVITYSAVERVNEFRSLYAQIESTCDANILVRTQAPDMSVCDRTTWAKNCRALLQKTIKTSLVDDKLDKYSSGQKLGILLLNAVTLLTFPIAIPLKKLFTNSCFFSLNGKLQDSAEDALEVAKNFKL